MDKVAVWSPRDHDDLFREAANRRGMAPAVAEKGFWVCWTLKQVFALPIGGKLLFMGGTSLSKEFGVIGRFSEDNDLSIHRDHLGFGGSSAPELIASKNYSKQ